MKHNEAHLTLQEAEAIAQKYTQEERGKDIPVKYKCISSCIDLVEPNICLHELQHLVLVGQ